MPLLSVTPEVVSAASENLQEIGSSVRSATAAAEAQTAVIAAPAADEVSAAITALFGTHAQEFQAASSRAAAFGENFAATLRSSLHEYLSAEAANVGQILSNDARQFLSTEATVIPQNLLNGIGTGQATVGGAAAKPPAEYYYPWGNKGLQTSFFGTISLPITSLGNNVAALLLTPGQPYALGNQIAPYLNGKPIITYSFTSGADDSGNILFSGSVTTPGGYGIGLVADTLTSNYGENLSLPVVGKESVTANAGAGIYGATGYLFGAGGGVVANTQQGIYAASVGGELPVVGGGGQALVQYHTGTGVSFAGSVSAPLDLAGVSVQANPGVGFYNATANIGGVFGSGDSVTWQPNVGFTTTGVMSGLTISDPSDDINDLLGGNSLLSGGVSNTGNLTPNEQLWQNYDNQLNQWDQAVNTWDDKYEANLTWLEKNDDNLEYQEYGLGPEPYPNLGPEPPAPGPYPVEPTPPDVPDD